MSPKFKPNFGFDFGGSGQINRSNSGGNAALFDENEESDDNSSVGIQQNNNTTRKPFSGANIDTSNAYNTNHSNSANNTPFQRTPNRKTRIQKPLQQDNDDVSVNSDDDNYDDPKFESKFEAKYGLDQQNLSQLPSPEAMAHRRSSQRANAVHNSSSAPTLKLLRKSILSFRDAMEG